MNRHRFSIFDAMEHAGVFDRNPANANARDKEGKMLYTGPVEYPRLVYHPEGKERVLVPGTYEDTPLGPKFLGEIKELIWAEAADAAAYAELKKQGWHDHPAKAIAAGNALRSETDQRPVPPISSVETITDLQQTILDLQKKLSEAQANQLVGKENQTIAAAKASVKSAGLV